MQHPDETHDWLSELRTEPLERDLDEVRARVMSRIARRRMGVVPWSWAALPVAVTLLAVFCWPVRHARIAQQPVQVEQAPLRIARSLNLPELSVRPTRSRVRRKQEPGIREAELVARFGEPVAIRLTTADPNVVILLQTEERKNVDE